MNENKNSFSENIVGTISHFFVTNRPLSILVIGAMIAFGVLAFVLMPKQYNPEIVRPAFAITLGYQGATIDQSLDRVVYELSEKIETVEGVDDVYITVRDGAVIETTVIFEVGADSTKAKVDLLAQLEQHSYLAQGYIQPPRVMEINPETIPVLHLVFKADTLGIGEMRKKIVELSHDVAGVEGVSEITVAGGYVPALVIELDNEKLNQLGLVADDVVQVLGSYQSRMVGAGVSGGLYKLEMVFDGQVETIDEISLLSVRDGVLIRDIARVYEGTSGSRSYVLNETDGVLRESLTMSVAKVEGSSAPVVTRAFLKELDSIITSDKYTGVTYDVVSDDGATATSEINGLMSNLITSIVIVAVVLLLFLSVRAAIVVLIAIPTTLVVVFGVGYLFDQTINRITLFALILSLGLLVDSAIVAVDNIYSHLREWKNSKEGIEREKAVAGAMHEIGIGLILSTVTSVIVFLPMKYITGMMGPYMAPIAFFVPMALFISMLVAIVVVPFVGAHILDPDEKPSRAGKISTLLMDKLIITYEIFLKKVIESKIRQRNLLLGVFGLFLVSVALPAMALVHFQMLPKADRDQFYVYLDLPESTDVEETSKISAKVSSIVELDEDVKSVQHFIAEQPMLDFNGMFKGAQARVYGNQSTLRVNLTPAAERDRSSTDIVTKIRLDLKEKLPEVTAAVRLMEDPPGPPVQATLVAKFIGSEETRTETAKNFVSYISNIEGVVDIDNSTDAAVSRVRYEYDRVAGESLAVSPTVVGNALRLIGEPLVIGEYLASDVPEYTPILLTTPLVSRTEPNNINGISVRNTKGEMVPLTAVVTTHTEARPPSLRLEDATPLTYVTAEIENRSIVYVTIDIIKGLIAGELNGYEVTGWNLFGLSLKNENDEIVELKWGGEWEMTLENFRDLGIAMVVALALVYAVLAAQYKRFDTPALILVTVPLGLIGILWGFFVLDTFFGIYLTATALIGFIALIGIVVNNAIIYLEYVEQSEQNGCTFGEALIVAGRARLRPILLTSLTTVLGSLTIAGDPVWSGLAWAIIFGLSLSTILTLVVYPTMLIYFRNK